MGGRRHALLHLRHHQPLPLPHRPVPTPLSHAPRRTCLPLTTAHMPPTHHGAHASGGAWEGGGMLSSISPTTSRCHSPIVRPPRALARMRARRWVRSWCRWWRMRGESRSCIQLMHGGPAGGIRGMGGRGVPWGAWGGMGWHGAACGDMGGHGGACGGMGWHGGPWVVAFLDIFQEKDPMRRAARAPVPVDPALPVQLHRRPLPPRLGRANAARAALFPLLAPPQPPRAPSPQVSAPPTPAKRLRRDAILPREKAKARWKIAPHARISGGASPLPRQHSPREFRMGQPGEEAQESPPVHARAALWALLAGRAAHTAVEGGCSVCAKQEAMEGRC
ncbi:unnamed protein product [Closterium sp. Naga37s-1]|nr:unnamed protein product [Closterium sp. Naga37s-1]